jgi:hypothetical protein
MSASFNTDLDYRIQHSCAHGANKKDIDHARIKLQHGGGLFDRERRDNIITHPTDACTVVMI